MGDFLSADFKGQPLVTFSATHVITLLALAILNVLFLVCMKKVRDGRIKAWARYVLSVLLFIIEAAYEIWPAAAGLWTADVYLPLQLCDLTLILSAVMLLNRNYFIYEVTYFTGIGGSMQALLTPDLWPYSFPHIMFFNFFLSHGLTITAILYMTLIEGFRPKLSSIWKTFVFTNAFMVVAAGVNLITGGNYLFLCSKPPTPSLLDVMGPWPWYLISLEIAGAAIFFILYSPFLIKDIVSKTGTANTGM